MSHVWEKANDVQQFSGRHIGPSESDVQAMLQELGYASLDELTRTALPKAIQDTALLDLPAALQEHEALAELKRIMSQNKLNRSYIGLGYYDTVTPSVVLRNVIENPAWY